MAETKTIDQLIKEQSKLALKKEQIEDKKNSKCSRIGVQIKKLEDEAERLRTKSVRLDSLAKVEIAEINRQIKKNQKQIQLEREYYFGILDTEKKSAR